jgi:hypothetical protein
MDDDKEVKEKLWEGCRWGCLVRIWSCGKCRRGRGGGGNEEVVVVA